MIFDQCVPLNTANEAAAVFFIYEITTFMLFMAAFQLEIKQPDPSQSTATK